MDKVKDSNQLAYVCGPSEAGSRGSQVQQWLNCETKIFSFHSDDDEHAKMIEIPAEGKIRPKDATNAPTTQDMQ